MPLTPLVDLSYQEGERSVKMIVNLVNEHLRPHVTSLQSYVKDAVHFLQIIDNLIIPENAFLVTIDVEALFSFIPHDKGLAAIKHIIYQRGYEDWGYNELILSLLE